MVKIIFYLGLLVLSMGSVLGQQLASTSGNLEQYKEELPFFQELITGGQYQDPPSNYDGDPFYLSKTFELGGLRINQIYYPEVYLLYDIRYDQVLTIHPVFSEKLLINPEKINEFRLNDGSVFQKLDGNESYSHHKKGFYQVLEEGRFTLVSKHYKAVKKSTEIGKTMGSYEEFEDFFLVDPEGFHPIKTKKQAIKHLGVSKKLVREKLTKNKIYFNQNKERFLKELVSVANQHASSIQEK